MTPSSAAGFAPISIVDARDGGPVRALREECFGWLPGVVAAAMPIIDLLARRWLERLRSPYVAEVRTIANKLQILASKFGFRSAPYDTRSRARVERILFCV